VDLEQIIAEQSEFEYEIQALRSGDLAILVLPGEPFVEGHGTHSSVMSTEQLPLQGPQPCLTGSRGESGSPAGLPRHRTPM
jgi:hypothetical protein